MHEWVHDKEGDTSAPTEVSGSTPRYSRHDSKKMAAIMTFVILLWSTWAIVQAQVARDPRSSGRCERSGITRVGAEIC